MLQSWINTTNWLLQYFGLHFRQICFIMGCFSIQGWLWLVHYSHDMNKHLDHFSIFLIGTILIPLGEIQCLFSNVSVLTVCSNSSGLAQHYRPVWHLCETGPRTSPDCCCGFFRICCWPWLCVHTVKLQTDADTCRCVTGVMHCKSELSWPQLFSALQWRGEASTNHMFLFPHFHCPLWAAFSADVTLPLQQRLNKAL